MPLKFLWALFAIEAAEKSGTSDVWLVVFTGALVGVGVLQFLAMRSQYAAMRSQEQWMRENVALAEKSANAAQESANAARDSASAATATVKAIKETSRKELRARVFVSRAARLGTASPGPFDAEITIKNFGKTPAYGCTCAIELVLRTNPPDDSAFPAPRITGQEPKMVLPPDGEFTIVKNLPVGTFGGPQHSQVMAGSHAVYVYGEIRYRDGFRKKRFNKFLMKCCGADYSLRRFTFAEKGNKAN